MALASTAAENAAVNAITALAGFVSLHTASPGTTGTSEASGVTRQAVAWGSASGGSATNTNAPAVPVGASQTVTHAAGWSAASAGNYEIGLPLASSIGIGTTAATVTFAAGSLSVGAS